MNWKGHLIFGIILTIIVYYFLMGEIVSYWKVLLVVMVYSLLPDIDSESSIIFRIFLAVCFSLMLVMLVLFYLYKSNYSLITIVAIVGTMLAIYGLSHRGMTHSLLLAIIFSLPLLFFSFEVSIIGFIAYVSHLIGDSELKFI